MASLRDSIHDDLNVEFLMVAKAEKYFSRLLQEYPGTEKEDLVKTLVAIHLNLMCRGDESLEMFNKIMDSVYFVSFEGDAEARNFKLRFNSQLAHQIREWSKAIGLTPSEAVGEAFHFMISIFRSQGFTHHRFWRSEVEPLLIKTHPRALSHFETHPSF